MSDPGVAQRASALEEKRRKLEELKKRREVRGADTARIQATQATTSLEDYIDDLLKGDSSGIGGTATGSTTAGTTTTTVTAGEGNDTAAADPTASLRHETGTSTPVLSTAASVATTNNSTTASNLTVETTRKQIEAFSISTQTDDELFSVENDENEQTKTNEPQEPTTTSSKNNEKNTATTASNAEMETTRNDATGSLIPKVLSLQEVEREVTKQPFSLFLNTASKKVERLLGAASSSTLIATTTTTTATDEFIMADYVAESMDIDHHNNNNKKDLLQNSDVQTKFVSSKFIYECPKWTNHRDVTDLDWSPIHKELLLSTYHNINSVIHSSGAAPTSTASTQVMDGTRSTTKIDQSSSSLTPRSGELLSDGLALIWSPMLPNRPEHVFTCGSPVMCGKFHPTDPTLVIGGCYSGQLVIWDIRSGRLPVQKSSIPTVSSTSTSSSGNASQLSLIKGHHAHSIGSMEVLDGGLSLVTASADGRLNFWSLTNLRDPAESIQIGDSISCFAVLPESETLVVGDEHGTMYTVASPNTSATTSVGTGDTNTSSGKNSPVPPSTASASGSGGGHRVTRRQVKKMDMSGDDDNHLGHYGMITAISAKLRSSMKSNNNNNLSQAPHLGTTSKGFFRGVGGLLVSSGVDWTVKLWGPAYHSKPLMSYVSHSYDYMSDVAWSPTHPSLFATASSNGSIGLWNLATSLDEPITGPDGIVVQPDAMSSGVGLNKVKWSADGRRLAVAASDKVHLLHVSEDVTRTKGDEETKVMNQLLARGLV